MIDQNRFRIELGGRPTNGDDLLKINQFSIETFLAMFESVRSDYIVVSGFETTGGSPGAWDYNEGYIYHNGNFGYIAAQTGLSDVIGLQYVESGTTVKEYADASNKATETNTVFNVVASGSGDFDINVDPTNQYNVFRLSNYFTYNLNVGTNRSIGNLSTPFVDGYFSDSVLSSTSFISSNSGFESELEPYFLKFNRNFANYFTATSEGGFFNWRVNGSSNDVMTLDTNGSLRLNNGGFIGNGSGLTNLDDTTKLPLTGGTVANYLDVDGDVNVTQNLGFPTYTGSGNANIYASGSELIIESGQSLGADVSAFYPRESGRSCGKNTTNNRWSTVYAANGTINTSDERVKENITPIDNALNKINAIGGYTYDKFNDLSKTGGSIESAGVLAQEVANIFPYAVNVPTNADELYGVNYARLTPLLIEGVKELKEENDNLKSQLAEVIARLDALEA